MTQDGSPSGLDVVFFTGKHASDLGAVTGLPGLPQALGPVIAEVSTSDQVAGTGAPALTDAEVTVSTETVYRLRGPAEVS